MRLLSLIVALGWVVFRLVVAQPKSLADAVAIGAVVCAAVLFPLACIWFPDEMSYYADAISRSDKGTPAGWVRAGGWVLLTLPFIVWWFALQA